MAMVRTTIRLPEEVLALVDELAGPGGRNAFMVDAVTRAVRHDRARRAFRETAGVLAGSRSWGSTPAAIDRTLGGLRAAWDDPGSREE